MGNELGMQYIMDGNGNYYRVNGKDQLVVAGSKEEATVFTFLDANKRIGGGRKAKFYQTIPVGDIESVESEMMVQEQELSKIIPILDKSSLQKDVVEHLIEQTDETEQQEVPKFENYAKEVKLEYDIGEIDWLDYMNLFCYLSNSAKDYQLEMAAKHSAVEKEICDLLHYIELYDLSDKEAMRAVDMLKHARQRRRDIKDEIMRVGLFQRSIGTSANVAKAKGCITELGKLETRIYHPRELTELFRGMENRKTDREVYRSNRSIYEEDEKSAQMEENRENTWQEEHNMEYCRQDTIYDGKENDWLGFAKEQLDFYANIQQYMINLELDLEDIDQAIEDVLRKIEDANYNVTQGYKAFKELKDLRNERKDKIREFEQLQAITGGFDCIAMADAFRYAVETVENIGATVEMETDS